MRARQATLDPLDDTVLSAMNNLALVYVYQNRYDEAATLYEAILRKRQEQTNPDDMEFAILLSNIAELKWKQGNFDVADAYYKRLDEIYQTNDFEYDDRAMLRESVEILETNRGADHKYTLEAKEDLKELESSL